MCVLYVLESVYSLKERVEKGLLFYIILISSNNRGKNLALFLATIRIRIQMLHRLPNFISCTKNRP